VWWLCAFVALVAHLHSSHSLFLQLIPPSCNPFPSSTQDNTHKSSQPQPHPLARCATAVEQKEAPSPRKTNTITPSPSELTDRSSRAQLVSGRGKKKRAHLLVAVLLARGRREGTCSPSQQRAQVTHFPLRHSTLP
jgi:hypothetical protein